MGRPEQGPHGDGLGDQGDLLADAERKTVDQPSLRSGGLQGPGSGGGEQVLASDSASGGEIVSVEIAPSADDDSAARDSQDAPLGEAGGPGREGDAREESERVEGENPQSAPPVEAQVDARGAAAFELVMETAGREKDEGSDGPASVARREARHGDERRATAKRLVEGGEVEKAVAIYREIIADDPRDLKARNNLGVLYDETGHPELALEQLEAACELDPGNVEVLTNLGSTLLGLSRFEDAERELRRAARLDPNGLEVHANLGTLLFRRGLYAEAEAGLGWVCARDAQHASAHFYRGEALNRLGRVEEALQVLHRARRLQPENGKIYYTLGILFDKKRMPLEAAEMYRKARELSR